MNNDKYFKSLNYVTMFKKKLKSFSLRENIFPLNVEITWNHSYNLKKRHGILSSHHFS